MAVTPLFTCICGIQKKTSNHWVLAKVTPTDIRFMPWNAKFAVGDDIIVLCGEGCAAALLSRSLGGWKYAETATVLHELFWTRQEQTVSGVDK
jgi:hypothetical protein